MTRPAHSPSPFDFITVKEFKNSLESDFKELQSAIEHKSWKAAQVLAGSLVEAMLIDYLLATNYKGLPEDKILGLHLPDAIDACKKAGVLTQTTADLTTVVAGYRNLIHPGRIIRLKEDVTEEKAIVALNLVKMITKDVARKRRESYGYTAGQIVTKILTDNSCMTFMHLLINEIHDTEKERLLLEELPVTNLEIRNLEMPIAEFNPLRQVLSKCFRLAFDASPAVTRQKAMSNFVKIVKEAPKDIRLAYEDVFVRAPDLIYILSEADRNLVKRHLLGQLNERGLEMHDSCSGIGSFVSDDDIRDGSARALWTPALRAADPDDYSDEFLVWKDFVMHEHHLMREEIGERFKLDIKRNVKTYQDRGMHQHAARCDELASICDGIPF